MCGRLLCELPCRLLGSEECLMKYSENKYFNVYRKENKHLNVYREEDIDSLWPVMPYDSLIMINAGLGNGLVLFRHQAITWTSDCHQE